MKIIVYLLIMLLNYKNELPYTEEALPIYNKNGELIKINYNITLNKNLEIYKIYPKIFNSLREFKSVKAHDKIMIDCKIKSKKGKYKYVKNSFNIETDSFINDRNNYSFLNKRGFDGKKINTIFIPWKANLKEKELNLEKIKQAYDYFYLNILDFSYDNIVYFNMDNYKDIKYNDGFKMYIRINENFKDIYKDYNYYGEISLKLKRN